MNSTLRYILLGSVVVGILALFIYSNSQKKKQFDWRETYLEDSKQPFGSFVFHKMLDSYFQGKKLKDLKEKIAKSLPNPDSLTENSNYVFVGDGFYADTADIDKLLLYVHHGNLAFIATNAVPNYFLERVYEDSCEAEEYESYRFRWDFLDTANLTFRHPQLAENKPFIYDFKIADKTQVRDWAYIDTLRGECTEGVRNLTPLGMLNETDINFVKVTYGKGAIYLHSNPIVYTNFHLLDTTKLRYVAKTLSHLPTGDIYWDTKSRTSREIIRRMNGGSNTRLNKEGPLKYVLEQPSLRWAWYIMLGLIGLYLVFGAKRKQRIIPVLEEKSNTSLDFIQTIGHMYFSQGEHIKLCDMMLKQFQTYVRERYHLATRDMDDEFMKTLALKSDIPLDRIQRILAFEKRIAYNDITEDDMVKFHHLLNNFYKTCK